MITEPIDRPHSPTPTLDQDIRYDPHYDDPTADIVFRSTTDTRFRISSWCLAKYRSVITFAQLTIPLE